MHTRDDDDWSKVYWALDRQWKDGRSVEGIREDTGLGRQRVGDLLEEHRSEVRQFKAKDGWPGWTLKSRPVDFLLERLRYLLEERGFHRRNVRAVTQGPLDEIRPLDARRKLEVLPEFTETSDFRTLATLFKRVENIARELEDGGSSDEPFETVLTEPAERALLDELKACRSVIEAAVETGTGFREAFAEAAKIGPAVDRFFNEVFVMADDMTLRRARLGLMRQVQDVILQLADVSEVVPET
jgi:glycyl-tRNA synthetase beta chain